MSLESGVIFEGSRPHRMSSEVDRKTPIEELDLPVGAYNVLKSRDVDFIEDIQPFLDRAAHPLSPRDILNRHLATIVEALRKWRGDSGDAGVLARI